jgi:hypothetical protein
LFRNLEKCCQFDTHVNQSHVAPSGRRARCQVLFKCENMRGGWELSSFEALMMLLSHHTKRTMGGWSRNFLEWKARTSDWVEIAKLVSMKKAMLKPLFQNHWKKGHVDIANVRLFCIFTSQTNVSTFCFASLFFFLFCPFITHFVTSFAFFRTTFLHCDRWNVPPL